MSLYPSLEDMKVDHLARAQAGLIQGGNSQSNVMPSAPMSTLPYPLSPMSGNQSGNDLRHMYPTLNEYMGIEFTEDVIAANMPEYLRGSEQNMTLVSSIGSNTTMIAPISGNSIGLQRAQVNHGIREMILCKGADGKIGVRVKDVNKGVFVSLVRKNSPASLAGLRFGDQILQINDKNVAGMSMETVHDVFRDAPKNGIKVAVRDRPFERIVTLHKDSSNHIGFQFKDGEIVALVKDSSAARNGLLTNHHLLEINGQNVVGLKDREISEIINECGQVVTVTVMPTFIYKHIIKHMASSVVSKLMDHSIPEL